MQRTNCSPATLKVKGVHFVAATREISLLKSTVKNIKKLKTILLFYGFQFSIAFPQNEFQKCFVIRTFKSDLIFKRKRVLLI